jgi:hypothetical protein
MSYILHKSCSVVNREHSEPLPLENHVHMVALTPDLQRVPFYSVTDFLHHSPTIELLLSPVLIKGSYLSPKALLTMWEIFISFPAAMARKFIHGLSVCFRVGNRSTNRFDRFD